MTPFVQCYGPLLFTFINAICHKLSSLLASSSTIWLVRTFSKKNCVFFISEFRLTKRFHGMQNEKNKKSWNVVRTNFVIFSFSTNIFCNVQLLDLALASKVIQNQKEILTKTSFCFYCFCCVCVCVCLMFFFLWTCTKIGHKHHT